MESISEEFLEQHGLLTVEAAAEVLGTTLKYARRLVERKSLHPVKILNRNLVRRTEVEAYARDHPELGSRTLTLATT